MKKLIYIQLFFQFFLLNNTCLSKEWLPFIQGQISYYGISNYYQNEGIKYELNGELKYNLLNAKDRIISVEIDSLINVNDEYSTYYLSNPLKAIENNKCYSAIKERYQSNSSLNGLLIDSFLVTNDKVILFEMKPGTNINYPLEIPLFLAIGDSLVSNKYTIKYLNIDYQEILPKVFDSVKTYSINYNYNIKEECIFKLSKNYGIIYYEVHDLYNQLTATGRVPLELVGIKNNDGVNGTIAPEVPNIDNFFSLKVGDIKYWNFDYTKDDIHLYYTKFYKDSLIKINQNEDKISFIFFRFEYEDGKINQSIVYENYQKNQLQDIINNPTANLYLMQMPFNNTADLENNDLLCLSRNYVTFDNKLIDNADWGFSLISNEELLEIDSCSISGSPLSNIRIFPNIGLVFLKLYGDFGKSVQTLIGYTINNKTYGDLLSIFNSISDIEEKNINIFPNPVSNELKLVFIPDGTISYEIYTILGIKQLEGRIENEINIEALPKGVYFLKLNKNNKVIKFVKE
ncbi:MAG: hypothetical protein A2X64_06445 [Ignavibacteria bacterium GWF2_33_9]|nr:MAG: hypothetical protein A2X64_06445 [Ignavibacteria bacterium GWF2_33_9]